MMRFLLAGITLASTLAWTTGCVCGPQGPMLALQMPGGCCESPCGGSGCDSCGPSSCDSCCGELSCGTSYCDDGCNDCCGYGRPLCFNPIGAVLGLVHSVGSSLFNPCGYCCDSGCGAMYVDEWISDPPACCDPCDGCGHFTGQSGCGCSSGGPRCGRGLATIWGFKYLGGGCGGGCNSCGCYAGACESGGCGGNDCGSGGCGCGGGGNEMDGEVQVQTMPYHDSSPSILQQPTVPHQVQPKVPTTPSPAPTTAKPTRLRRVPAQYQQRRARSVSHVRR